MRRPSRLTTLLIAGVTVLAAGGAAAYAASSSGDGEDSSAEDDYAKRADDDLNDDDTVTMYVSEHSDKDSADKTEKETGSCKVPDHSSLDDAFEELDDVGDVVDEVKLCDPAYTVDSDSLTMAADDIRIAGNTGDGNLADEPRVTIDEHDYEGNGAPFRVRGDNVTLEGIEFSGSPGYGVDASDTDGLEIDQNVFNDNAAGAVRTSDSENVTIANNTIATNASRAMTLLNTDDVVVASNEFHELSSGREKPGIVLAGGDDTVDVQGNQIDGPKSAVYVDRTDDADSANKDVDVHMNSFDEIDHGVAVTSEDAIAGGKIGARDNYWAGAEGSDVDTRVADGADVDIDTGDALNAPFTESYTDPADPEKVATTPKVTGSDEQLTMVLFDDPPRKGISDAVGQYVGLAVAGEDDDLDRATVDLGLSRKTAPKDMDKNMAESGSYRNMVSGEHSIRWYDTSGDDPSWRKVDTSVDDTFTEASIDSESTPSIGELDGTIFVAQDK